MKLERIGIGTKRMGILLCTSLKSTISDWIGAGTGLVAFQPALRVCYTCERALYECMYVCMSVRVWLSAFSRILFSMLLLAVGGLCLRRGLTVNAVYLFKKL